MIEKRLKKTYTDTVESLNLPPSERTHAMHNHRHSIHCILPPHVLKEIATNGTEEQKQADELVTWSGCEFVRPRCFARSQRGSSPSRLSYRTSEELNQTPSASRVPAAAAESPSPNGVP